MKNLTSVRGAGLGTARAKTLQLGGVFCDVGLRRQVSRKREKKNFTGTVCLHAVAK